MRIGCAQRSEMCGAGILPVWVGAEVEEDPQYRPRCVPPRSRQGEIIRWPLTSPPCPSCLLLNDGQLIVAPSISLQNEYHVEVSSMGVIVGTEDGRPVVRGVVLDDSGIEVGEIQHLSDLLKDVRTQLEELAKAIETAIQANTPEVMVIRPGRIHMWERRRTVAAHARAEGVLLATSRDRGIHVLVMDGDEVGRTIGGDRASADKAAQRWASKDFVKAGAAALAAHSIAQRGGRSSC